MKKRIIYKNNFNFAKLLSRGEDATVIKLNDGNILKIFHPETIDVYANCGIDIESKILNAYPIKNSPEILVPTSAVYYEDGTFLGYTIPKATGISFNTYDKNLTLEQRVDLKKYAIVHYKLESVLRRNQEIVFPDICTCDNIFIDKKGNVEFIDYDGLQVGPYRTLSLSTSVGSAEKIIKNPKYFNKALLYTKELDKRSSIILYFLCAFNVDLTKVGEINPITGEEVTLSHVFEAINLDDLDICHKVWKIFQDNQKNDFLEKDVFRIAEKYELNIIDIYNNTYVKKLTKKS